MPAQKKCPFCAEPILAEAKKCKHCSEFFGEHAHHEHSRHARSWNPGAAAVLSFFVPGLGQIYKGDIAIGLCLLVFTVLGYMVFLLPGIPSTPTPFIARTLRDQLIRNNESLPRLQCPATSAPSAPPTRAIP